MDEALYIYIVVVGAMIGLRTLLYALMKYRRAAGETLDRDNLIPAGPFTNSGIFKGGKFGRQERGIVE